MKKEKVLPTEYVDTVLFDIVREFYMQRGDGAKFRTVLVGRKYFEKTLYRKVIVEKDFKRSLAQPLQGVAKNRHCRRVGHPYFEEGRASVSPGRGSC